MPFLQTEDALADARPLDPGMADRLRSSAAHPSSRGPAPRLVNIRSPYQPLEAPEDAQWPRATVRPTPLLDGPGHAWAGKIWAAQGVPAKKSGTWVTKTSKDLSEVVDWAAVEVERRRPKATPPREPETPC